MVRKMFGKDDAAFKGLPRTLQQAMMEDLSIAQLRAASPLPEDTQRVIDQAVVSVGMDRLVVVDDFISAGLTYPLTDPLSVMFVQWDNVARSGFAKRTMNPAARGENQLPDRSQNRVPIYITSDDFFFGIRTLKASQRVGAPLDITMVEQATRNVNEAIEDAMLNGIDFNVDGYTAYGLLNAPNHNTITYGSNEAWDASGHDGQDILDDVLRMVDELQEDRRFGPYNLYVPTTYGNKLNNDFKTNGDISILARLQQIVAGGRNLVVKTADQLPANKTVMVQMTRDVADVIDGQAPVVVPWTSNDGFTLYWLVMAIMVPRVKTDSNDASGIVVGYPT